MAVSIEDRMCNNCNHSDICKYKEDFLETYDEIQNIGDEKEVFITVVVKCKHWLGKINNIR
jgi:hypothetical protein